ncbi:hypothetical protein B0T19DRAFT_423259 [Cercophora scortea]|uniref:Uncharacterized protein n=1 Tax=Cercophora scortea TaxID=314031 RepID=A0AAE0MCY0_9PEZI|nr:hypothetical protein B0T19DRAFT_423259 [Cercophora scortea]
MEGGRKAAAGNTRLVQPFSIQCLALIGVFGGCLALGRDVPGRDIRGPARELMDWGLNARFCKDIPDDPARSKNWSSSDDGIREWSALGNRRASSEK